jgi:hypothetical protein
LHEWLLYKLKAFLPDMYNMLQSYLTNRHFVTKYRGLLVPQARPSWSTTGQRTWSHLIPDIHCWPTHPG